MEVFDSFLALTFDILYQLSPALIAASPYFLSFGLVAAFIGWKKGRSPIIWFFIGMLMGFIGLVVVLLIPRRTPKVEENFIVPQTKT